MINALSEILSTASRRGLALLRCPSSWDGDDSSASHPVRHKESTGRVVLSADLRMMKSLDPRHLTRPSVHSRRRFTTKMRTWRATILV